MNQIKSATTFIVHCALFQVYTFDRDETILHDHTVVIVAVWLPICYTHLPLFFRPAHYNLPFPIPSKQTNQKSILWQDFSHLLPCTKRAFRGRRLDLTRKKVPQKAIKALNTKCPPQKHTVYDPLWEWNSAFQWGQEISAAITDTQNHVSLCILWLTVHPEKDEEDNLNMHWPSNHRQRVCKINALPITVDSMWNQPSRKNHFIIL